MSLLYQILLCFLFLGYLPKFIYDYFARGKYHHNFLSRFGVKSEKIRHGSPTIWIHAVSVGEIKGASTLIKQLKEEYPLSCIIVSSVTETGHKEAKKVAPMADYHLFLPFDFKATVAKVIGQLKLDLVLVIETDIWPNFLQKCKMNGAKVILVNGKISQRSYERLKHFNFFAKWYYSLIDYFLVQDEVFRSRFVDLHIHPENIKIVPNLKLDDSYEELNEEDLESLRIKFDVQDISIVIGSTHDEEEEAILNQIISLFGHYHHLKVFVVPRHPERFDEVERIIKKFNLPYGRYSHDNNFKGKKIILVDTLGQLRKFYQLCTLAIVAGSFNPKVGGHNILEPLWYSTPCIFGPYMFSQDQFVSLVLHANAGRQVAITELRDNIYELLNDDFKLKQMGRRGKDIFIKFSGGTKQTLEFIKKVLEKKNAS